MESWDMINELRKTYTLRQIETFCKMPAHTIQPGVKIPKKYRSKLEELLVPASTLFVAGQAMGPIMIPKRNPTPVMNMYNIIPGTELWFAEPELDNEQLKVTWRRFIYIRDVLSFHENEQGNFAQFTAWICYEPATGSLIPMNPLVGEWRLFQETAHVEP